MSSESAALHHVVNIVLAVTGIFFVIVWDVSELGAARNIRFAGTTVRTAQFSAMFLSPFAKKQGLEIGAQRRGNKTMKCVIEQSTYCPKCQTHAVLPAAAAAAAANARGPPIFARKCGFANQAYEEEVPRKKTPPVSRCKKASASRNDLEV